MAQLKDTIVSGNLRVTDTTLTDTLHVTTIKAPTSSGGTTYGPGTNGQILKSNGTMTYWADMPTIPTVNNASLTLKGAGTTVTTFTANSSTNQSLDIVAGTNVTIEPDATNHKITISSSDTKVTSSANHYTPATASGGDISKSASGATAAWNIDVVKGVTLNTDGKGHVTGLSVTSGKIPGNPVPSNNVTGSGTSGYLTKWNGTNTITNGPQLGSSTTTFLRNDGSWATPTDTKVNVTLATTSKAYLLGTTTTPTGTAAGVTSVADTGVYLTTTAGELCATKFMTSGKNGYYTHDSDNAKYPLVYENATNLWVGAEGSTSYPHKGETFISAGWLGTLPTTPGETLTGNSTIKISVPKYTAGSNGGTWNHSSYSILHTGNTSVTTSGSGNAITSLSFSNGTFTATKGSTFSLSTHTHGLLNSSFDQSVSDASETGWSILGIDVSTNGFILKSLRDNTTDTDWMSGGYGAGIAFGGSDTKGVISMRWNSPVITFAGGNHSSTITSPTWHFKITGTSGKTYNFDNYMGAVKIDSYYGMAYPDGADTSWIRTTRNGIIPYAKNDNTTDGNVSSLGTSTWTFMAGYINDIHYKDLKTVTVVAGNTADNAIDKMAGSFFFSGAGLFGGVNDWVGIQAGYDSDKFQLAANGTSGVLYRHNDTGGTDTTSWTAIKNLMTPEAVSGQDGITVTKRTNTLGTGSTALTYDSGVIIGHSNSVNAVTTAVFKKITYDAQGHITGTANVTDSDLPSHTHNYAGSSSAGGPATKVATTVTNGTASTVRYGIAFVADPNTSNAQAVLKNNDFRFNMKNGTDETGNTGNAEIVLGNSTPSGTAGNKKGVLTLYSTGSYYGNLDTGTLTANRTHTLPDASGTIKLEKRSMMYDDTSDWASYSWHKFAEITSSTNYDDKAITFLVSRTYDTDYSGILSVHVRINGSKNYQKHQFKWLIADEYIDPNNFVLVYTNNGTTSCKIELWYKQSQIYEGWIFEVLKEHTRMASENAWTVYTTSGHGSATYTAGTNHYASELACVQSKTALYTVKGTHTTTTNAWTGKIDANVLYDGMTIAYYLPYSVSPSASVTLNLTLSNGTTTGAINCYQNNTTRITTHYGAGSTIILTYWSAGSISVAGTATTDNRWTRCDYNSNNSVTQNNTTTSASYRVIFSGNANDTNETTTVRKNANLQFNPSTATLSIGKSGTTQGSIIFNNSEGGHATLKSSSKGTSPTFLLPNTGGNGEHTLSTGMYDLSVAKGSLTVTNVENIPAHTMAFKIVFKSDSTTPIYSMIEIPDLGNNIDYGGLIQVGTYGDGSAGSPRVVMKAVIVKITAGSTTGTRTFTATVSPTQKISGSSVSTYTRNVSIEKIYACT